MSVDQVFAALAEQMEKEKEVREKIREARNNADIVCTQAVNKLTEIHSGKSLLQVASETKSLFPIIQQRLQEIAVLVPRDEYYRFSDIFRSVVQNAAFAAIFANWMETEKLLTLEETEQALGLGGEGSLHLDLEDYLYAVASLPSELSRLCITSVARGDYSLSPKAHSFVNHIFSGFRQLNLKNDGLRRKFDSIKYDVKKIEEVIYDLAIRGLSRPSDDKNNSAAAAESSAL